MNLTAKPLDVNRCPLPGVSVVEASAGTGKTYALVRLFLRHILDGTPIEEILVVTFTTAATEELRERVRRDLRMLLREVEGGPEHYEEFAPLLAGRDPAIVLSRTRTALAHFDDAAIYTIHAFCQRVLTDQAFESGALFDRELSVDSRSLIEEIAADTWRRTMFGAPGEVIGFAGRAGLHPGVFVQLLEHVLSHPDATLPFSGRRIEHSKDLYLSASQAVPEEFKHWGEALAWLETANMPTTAELEGEIAALLAGGRSRDIAGRAKRLAESLSRAEGPAVEADRSPALLESTDESYLEQALLARGSEVSVFWRGWLQYVQARRAVRERLVGHLLAILSDLSVQGPAEVRKRREERGQLSYDDLLFDVRRAVETRRSACEAIRRQYRAALIDEFQDTDPQQWAIFRETFGRSPAHSLFLIGDPKQSIYRFRGADVYAYLDARGQAQHVYSLDQNFRSVPGLVEAINTIFTSGPAPFLTDAIPFRPAVAAINETDDAGAPLRIWLLEHQPGAKAWPAAELRTAAARETATEIVRLCREENAAPGEIAILVRTNREAELVRACLVERSIPAMLRSDRTVFEAPEARDLEVLLSAIERGTDLNLLRRALATELMGYNAAEIMELFQNEGRLEARRLQFQESARLWHSRGFMSMFEHFLNQERLRERLVARTGGERTLTNVLHMAELIHAAGRHTPEAALRWLNRQIGLRRAGQENEQIRLESDEAAVQILTKHLSKGLEFPFVFVPFPWSGMPERPEDSLIVHRPADRGVALEIIDPVSRRALRNGLLQLPGADREELARAEGFAEDVRLMYVALTRASRRLYVIFGQTKLLHGSAAAFVFFRTGIESPAQVQRRVKSLSDSQMLAALQKVASRAPRAMLCELKKPGPELRLERPHRNPEELTLRRVPRAIVRRREIKSYTRLLRQSAPGNATVDWPSFDRDEWAARPVEGVQAIDIHGFPGGARAGVFFHEILENLNFQATSSEIDELVREALISYRYELAFQRPIVDQIERLLQVRLPQSSFCLKEVPRDARRSEMEFYFPLTRGCDAGPPSLLPQALKWMEEENIWGEMGGHLRGFIDLVMQHEGRYYIVDWKSNWLGPTQSDYGADALDRAMQHSHYELQYYIYTDAVERLLRLRLKDFDYERHFGGVYYVFLRGVNESGGGVFYDRPRLADLEAFRAGYAGKPAG